MNRRILKKVAKRYLDGGDIRKYILGIDVYPVCGYWKTELIVPTRLYRAIYKEAIRRGWNGNHWDNPLVVAIDPE